MPRKQRFKPSRKPKDTSTAIPNPEIGNRQEVHPDDVQVEPDVRVPAREESAIDKAGSESPR